MDPERARFQRQVALPDVGLEGQRRLAEARVLVVGAGGLGCPAALYLAAAGIGTIGLADDDTVAESNLHRQVLYTPADVGRSKTEVAQERLRALDDQVNLVQHPAVTADNARDLVAGYHIVLDGTDNLDARYLLADACVLEEVPLVHGSLYRHEAQVSLFHPPAGPCYRCLYPTYPSRPLADCATAGVLGVLPGLVGTLMATEAVKHIVGFGRSLAGRLLLYDAAAMAFDEIAVPKRPDCALCGPDPTITDVEPSVPSVTPADLDALLADGALLVDIRGAGQAGVLPGARRVEADHVGGLEHDGVVVVACQRGISSQAAVRSLRARGVDAVSLAGGVEGWVGFNAARPRSMARP
ncbi:MAG: ThiF family adenylyltransferase [Thermoplasmatota archaeon]